MLNESIDSIAQNLSDAEYRDALALETRPELVAATLRRLRESLSPRDIPLFDAVCQFGEVKQAAENAGVKYCTARNRMKRWRLLIESPGPSVSPDVGVPLSTRPDARLTIACAEGNPVALKIADSWRFAQPVRTMPSERFDALVGHGYTTHSAA